jgi:hypothetical protein
VRLLIDALGLAGVAMIGAGVYLCFGLGESLIASGVLVIACAIYAGAINGGVDASDTE